MANYDKRYELQSRPTAANDGSSSVRHNITAVYRLEGSSDPWIDIPGRRKMGLSVPAAEMKAVLDIPNGSAKVTAYKQALASNLNTTPEPIRGWDAASLEALLDANDRAIEEADRADAYITVDLGLVYPVRFEV